MNMNYINILLAALLAVACNSNESNSSGPGNPSGPEEPQVTAKDIKLHITSANKTLLWSESGLDFAKAGSMSPNQIRFTDDPDASEIEGFGLAITTATAYNLLKMSKEDRTAFLTELFSEENGAGSSLIRVSIGASDFCLKDEDTGGDTEGHENCAGHG